MAKVWLAVEVDIPDEFDVDELPGYLSKFIDIGIGDLRDSCADDELDVSDEEKVVSKSEWGVPVLLPCSPIGIE